MELNTDIDIKDLPLGEESRQELENALTIINAIPDIDISNYFNNLPDVDFSNLPNVDFNDLPDVDFNDLPDVDFNDLPDIDFSNLPDVDFEGIGNTIKADIAHRGVDNHKLRISKSGVRTGVFRGHK